MKNHCAFSKNHSCPLWTDYELTCYELEEANLFVVDFLNQHNTDLLACLWNDLYTVISLQKEKGPRAPYLESCVL